ncbi:beta-galactoside alpha-2,6-sialyltransferase 2-like [Branchiostoma floridae x Branchiostoma belcheri]
MEKRILRFLGTVLCVCVTICVYSIMTRSEYAPAYGPKSLNATKIWRQVKNDNFSTITPKKSDNFSTITPKKNDNFSTITPKKNDNFSTITKAGRDVINSVSTLREELLCALKKNVPFSTITRKQASKDGNAAILPEESLEKLVHFNSCAVVSSSHGLRLHKYGQEIDSHDAVLRFNCAPTQGFEQFVGNRTDIRLINTQIPGQYLKKDFWSKNSNMFKQETIVVRNMDSISVKGEKIDTKGDHFHVFDNLIKYGKMYPERDLHFIQRPDFGNDIMRELARFCITTRMCNKANMSPSSGIFGVVMMLHLCDWVRVYEIVPSNKDRTTVPYYYDEQTTTTWTWLKKWHSFTQERVYLRTLSLTTERDIEDTGVVLLKGFSQTQCD